MHSCNRVADFAPKELRHNFTRSMYSGLAEMARVWRAYGLHESGKEANASVSGAANEMGSTYL